MAKPHEARRVGGFTYEEICATNDTKRLNSWRELGKVLERGKRCKIDFTKSETAVNTIQLEIARVEQQVSQIDADVRQLSYVPGDFASVDDLPETAKRRIAKLADARALKMKERADLTRSQMKHRKMCVDLDAEIRTLRRAQVNLEAVVQNESPASGPRGGIAYVQL